MGGINHNEIDNGDVDVYTPEYSFESNSDSVPDPDAPPIKSIDDNKMNHILELFH